MKLFILLLSTICFLLCEGADITIINGHEVVPHSRPYMALMKTPKGTNMVTMCGGSLITAEWVLTAAHCDVINNETTVTLGVHSIQQNEPEKQTIEVIEHYVYKPFNFTNLKNDIQLVRLSEMAKLGAAVATLPLPRKFNDPKKGTACVAAGWGQTENANYSDTLMETNITVLERRKCKKLWKNRFTITKDMLCTNVDNNKKASCKGDSGGPLFCNGVFRGVNSFSYKPCGTPGTADVFTRLTKKYITWIRRTIRPKTVK